MQTAAWKHNLVYKILEMVHKFHKAHPNKQETQNKPNPIIWVVLKSIFGPEIKAFHTFPEQTKNIFKLTTKLCYHKQFGNNKL